jgi:hypothetical protein
MTSAAHRDRLAAATAKHNMAGDNLMATKEVLAELRETGSGVLVELDRQEDVIKRSQSRVCLRE